MSESKLVKQVFEEKLAPALARNYVNDKNSKGKAWTEKDTEEFLGSMKQIAKIHNVDDKFEEIFAENVVEEIISKMEEEIKKFS